MSQPQQTCTEAYKQSVRAASGQAEALMSGPAIRVRDLEHLGLQQTGPAAVDLLLDAVDSDLS